MAQDPRRWKALAVLGIAYLMVVLDISIVNVALPQIQEDLGFAPENLQWVISGYALTFGGFLLLGGRAGDLLGRRKVFVTGLILFAAFSLLCGFSTSDGMLIAARALQGAAGAILSPSVFSITMVTFEEGPERNKALGILGAIAGSGAAIGVLLGGILTEYAGWQWIFYVNAPIAVIALLLVYRYVSESRVEGLRRHFDALGATTVTAGLMLLVYALTQANNAGWGSAQTIGMLIGAVVLLLATLVIEQRSPSPLVPLSFFKRRTPTRSACASKRTGASKALDASDLQPVRRDFAFLLDDEVAAGEVLRAALSADRALISDVGVFDVFTGKGVPEGKKSLAIEVTLQPRDKTLTDAEIEAVAAKVVAAVKKATGGELRG